VYRKGLKNGRANALSRKINYFEEAQKILQLIFRKKNNKLVFNRQKFNLTVIIITEKLKQRIKNAY
jgi:hypothetical protein